MFGYRYFFCKWCIFLKMYMEFVISFEKKLKFVFFVFIIFKDDVYLNKFNIY